MGNNYLIDASSHLAQFNVEDEPTRIAAKNMSVYLLADENPLQGHISDNENGLIDRTIWKQVETLQDAYYPFMDRSFSKRDHRTTHIQHRSMTQEEAEVAVQLADELRVAGFTVDFGNSLICANAIVTDAREVRTLYTELLNPDVTEYMRQRHGLEIRPPRTNDGELEYHDRTLELAYQKALTKIRSLAYLITGHIDDPRLIERRIDYSS